MPANAMTSAANFAAAGQPWGGGYVDPYYTPRPAGDPNQDTEQKRLADARAGMMANTEGRAGELANDPRLASAMDFFARTMGGAEGPYTEGSKTAMLNKQASMSSAAQAAQMKALQDATAAAGGSVYDPSYQAKVAEMNANRQGANQNAAGAIEREAAQANFGARMGGAGQLVGARMGQNAQINQMRGQAADIQRDTSIAVPTGTPTGAQTRGGITTQAKFGMKR